MSSDFFLEFEDNNYNAEQHHGSNIEESNSKQFRGSTRLNQKIDLQEEGDNTVKLPTVGSQYIDNAILQQSQQLEVNKVLRIMQFSFSPSDSILEENPLVFTQKPELQKDSKDLKDLIQTNTTQREFMKTFLKAVKSYSNRFIKNMLQKHRETIPIFSILTLFNG